MYSQNTRTFVIVGVPFGVWGRIRNSTVSVPDHFIFIYIALGICTLTDFKNAQLRLQLSYFFHEMKQRDHFLLYIEDVLLVC